MHRITLLLALLAVFLLAPAATDAATQPGKTRVAKATAGLTVPKGTRAERLRVGVTRPAGKGRSVKCHSWGTWIPQCGGWWDFHAWAAGNRRCGDWYNWFLAFGWQYMGCQETVVEWGCYWVSEAWRNSMAQCGVRWTNGGYAGGQGPYRCRKGYVVYGWGDRSNPANYAVYDHGSYPESCGWGFW